MGAAGTLLIRTDASLEIGTGHVLRCLALAQAWKDGGGRAIFLTATETPGLLERLRQEAVVESWTGAAGGAEDARAVSALAAARRVRWVVVDGYHFSSAYQRELKQAGLAVLAMDDYRHCEHYFADLVLNQNIHAHAGMYDNKEPGTQLLLGPQYALLRREFMACGSAARATPAVARKILVTLGGADPENAAGEVVEALKLLGRDDLEVRVLVGAANPNRAALEHAIAGARGSFELVSAAEEMPALMLWADMAVAAAGTTCWEMLFLRLPFVAISLADNQRPTAEHFRRERVVPVLLWPEERGHERLARAVRDLADSAERRAALSRRGREIVDGGGAQRVAALLRQPPGKGKLP